MLVLIVSVESQSVWSVVYLTNNCEGQTQRETEKVEPHCFSFHIFISFVIFYTDLNSFWVAVIVGWTFLFWDHINSSRLLFRVTVITRLVFGTEELNLGLRAAAFADGLAVAGTEDAQSSSGEKKKKSVGYFCNLLKYLILNMY